MKTNDLCSFVEITEIDELSKRDYENVLKIRRIDDFTDYKGNASTSEIIKRILSYEQGIEGAMIMFKKTPTYHTVHGFSKSIEKLKQENNFLKDIDEKMIFPMNVVTALTSLVKEETDRSAKPVSIKKEQYSFKGGKYDKYNVLKFDNNSKIMPIAKYPESELAEYLEHCLLLRREKQKDMILQFGTTNDSGWC